MSAQGSYSEAAPADECVGNTVNNVNARQKIARITITKSFFVAMLSPPFLLSERLLCCFAFCFFRLKLDGDVQFVHDCRLAQFLVFFKRQSLPKRKSDCSDKKFVKKSSMTKLICKHA
jgi:hypothetical protein